MSVPRWEPGAPTFVDKHGRQIDFETWRVLLNDPTYKMIGQTQILSFEVVTVWIGIRSGSQLPQLFETGVFGIDPPITPRRYDTLREAYVGHDAAVLTVYGVLLKRKAVR